MLASSRHRSIDRRASHRIASSRVASRAAV